MAALIVAGGLVGGTSLALASNPAQKVEGAGYQGGHFDLSARSGANGQNPSGYVRDAGANGLGYDVSGHVTCLAVDGNTAAIGFEIDHSVANPGAVGGGMILYVRDGGPPRGGQPVDFLDGSAGTSVAPEPGQCPVDVSATTPITQGNIRIASRDM
jgi:hypothetical protein